MNNNDKNKKTSVSGQVLDKIKSGDVKMHSKSYFVLKTILFILGTILALTFTLFIVSFIIFILRANGILFLPGFGFRGFGAFFTSFPWILLAVAVLFIVVLELFVKRFKFGYRNPFLYSVIGIVAIALIGGFIVAQTQFHGKLFNNSQVRGLPIAGHLYKRYGTRPIRNVYIGTVLEETDDGFKMETREGDKFSVIISPDTFFPHGRNIQDDDIVIVMGKRNNGVIEASGIRVFENGSDIFIPNRKLIRMRLNVK